MGAFFIARSDCRLAPLRGGRYPAAAPAWSARALGQIRHRLLDWRRLTVPIHPDARYAMRAPMLTIAVLLCLGAAMQPDLAQAAGGLNEIPPKRLLLIFPIIVLIIIGVLLAVTRRK